MLLPTEMVTVLSAVRTADPSGKEAVIRTVRINSLSVGAEGEELKPITVGTSSPSASDISASDTANPAAVPEIVIVSAPSPARSSSVPARLKVLEPLVCPAAMVTVKSSTAA